MLLRRLLMTRQFRVIDGVRRTSKMVKGMRKMMRGVKVMMRRIMSAVGGAIGGRRPASAVVIMRRRWSGFWRHRIHPQDGGGRRRAWRRTAVSAVNVA